MLLRKMIRLMALLGCWSAGYAQEGAVHLQNYPPSNTGVQTNALVQTKHKTILLANARGATQYNGQQWQPVQAQSTLYALLDDSTVVYTGGRSSFGFLQLLPSRQYRFQSLSRSSKKIPKEIGDFHFVKGNTKFVYFLSNKVLIEVDRAQRKVTRVWQNQAFQSLMVFKEKVLVNIYNKGLHQVPAPPKDENNEDKKPSPLVKVNTQVDFGKIKILSAFTSTQFLYVTAQNKVYRFDGAQWSILPLAAQKYLEEHTLTQGTLLSSGQLALGTLNGGVLIVAPTSGKTLYMINHQTGLPDDEVQTLAADHRQGLWIVHTQGISRAVLRAPVTNFTHYPGLVGTPTSVTYWQKQLYVATSEGLFQLKKTRNFQDLVTPIKRQQQKGIVVSKQAIASTGGVTLQSQKVGGTVVGNLINNVFGKKKVVVTVKPRQQPKAPTKAQPKLPLRQRNILQRELYALSSFPYFYHKIPGFSARVKQIAATANELLLGSNQGLYVYQNGKVAPVLKEVYIHQVKKSPNNEQLAYVATSEGVKSVTKQGEKWKLKDDFAAIKAAVYSMAFIGSSLWLGGDNQAIKVQTTAEGQYQSHQVYQLPRYYVENVQVVGIGQAPVLFLSNGLYRLDTKKQQFYRDSLLKDVRLPYQMVQRQGANVWTNLQQKWLNLADSSQVAHLALCSQVNDIYHDEAKNIWVVDKNQVLRIAPASTKDSPGFEVLVAKVFDHQQQNLKLDNIRLYQGAKAYSLTFELGATHYLNEASTQYQYRIKGLTKGWSEWKNNAEIKFTFLPSGKHTLELRAKNAIGEISPIKKIRFRVVPPFWKRWWFYLLEVLVLAGLVVASAVSSRFERFERYSSIITFVTIITVFEFFMITLEPSVDDISGGVPVFKLFMNILLAMSLNPLERRFSAWLSENKHRFQQK
ncbi:triple tyrosine motif-containing protein [uncultured Microscilla sp.]|uniref:triple tyrosine motif-containing protein n=1 Tax=uncultured Microscilla sp. TaxID=432653 RepID=UPI002610DA56|nr:triple tyrosine motif-containing protein [uncultured Microscilla sp.]